MKVFSSIGRFILFAVVNSLSLKKVPTKNLFRNISLHSACLLSCISWVWQLKFAHI